MNVATLFHEVEQSPSTTLLSSICTALWNEAATLNQTPNTTHYERTHQLAR
jgi:hypothetical protein